MSDRVLNAFLRRQEEEGLTLAAESDLLRLVPSGNPPDRYIAQFHCTGLVKREPFEIVEADRFEVGFWFSTQHLRMVNPFLTITWLGPTNIWHPNVSATEPFICIGRVAPGMGLVDMLYQVFEIITWNKVTMREDDALNPAACQWARRHLDRFPVDRRPLKRTAPQFTARELTEGSGTNVQTA
jgi:hypothetical protein